MSGKGADGSAKRERGTGQGHDEQEATRTEHDPRRTAVEWVTLAVSAAILLVLVVTLLRAQLSGGGGGTDEMVLEARAHASEARAVGSDYHVPVQVRNAGRKGAREVQVRVSLTGAGAAAETVELRFEVLAAGAQESRTAVFRSDPRRGQVEARVVAYQEG